MLHTLSVITSTSTYIIKLHTYICICACVCVRVCVCDSLSISRVNALVFVPLLFLYLIWPCLSTCSHWLRFQLIVRCAQVPIRGWVQSAGNIRVWTRSSRTHAIENVYLPVNKVPIGSPGLLHLNLLAGTIHCQSDDQLFSLPLFLPPFFSPSLLLLPFRLPLGQRVKPIEILGMQKNVI